ncbi:MAG: hypothetical protein FJ030_10640 [Chloroflexi bacterium]|nr:hypothetical protein [Chloroflexota bacterium]
MSDPRRHPPSAICHLPLAACLLLASCAASPSLPEIAPPLVITVVVTPTGGAAIARSASATEPASPTLAASESPYPAPFQASVSAVYQDFERGFMIYLSDRKAIWVFVRSMVSSGTTVSPANYGAWFAFADSFQEGDLETDPTIVAPQNFQQPKRGFGKVWRENAEVRDGLGWALDFERPYQTTATDFSIGAFDSPGNYAPQSFIHTLSALDGGLIHVDEATKVWSKP